MAYDFKSFKTYICKAHCDKNACASVSQERLKIHKPFRVFYCYEYSKETYNKQSNSLA